MINILSLLMMFCRCVQSTVLRTFIPKRRLGIKRCFAFVLVLPLLLASCVREPSEFSVDVSEYDGTVKISTVLFPVRYIYGGSFAETMGLSYIKGSDDVYIRWVEFGIQSILSVGVNIDGNFYDFNMVGTTDFETEVGKYSVSSYSINAFKVSVDFLKKMNAGKKVIIQIRTTDGFIEYKYKEGCEIEEESVFVMDSYYACEGVDKFIKEHLS